MSSMTVSREELVRLVTRMVVERLQEKPSVPVGVSNRHIHLCQQDLDVLFGKNSCLHPTKALGQPGQFACEETVTLKGPKGELKKVRVLGPLRGETQVEISVSDGFAIGVKPPVRESGSLAETPGVEIIGPCGSVQKQSGVIAALRHIHLPPAQAARLSVKDKDIVCVTVGDSTRGAIFRNVLIRVSDQFAPEMHLDLDEANAVGAKNGDPVFICK